MPDKFFALEDRRYHTVTSLEFQELAELTIDQGPHLVIATGSIEGFNAEYNMAGALRLEVHGTFHFNLAATETRFQVPAPPVFANQESFALMVATTVPFEGGAGGGDPPPPPPPRPRAVLSGRKASSGTGAFGVSDVRIVAVPFAELVQTITG
jgi:hypothetical protein